MYPTTHALIARYAGWLCQSVKVSKIGTSEEKVHIHVHDNCSGYLYRVLGQSGVNCWGALSVCSEWSIICVSYNPCIEC